MGLSRAEIDKAMPSIESFAEIGVKAKAWLVQSLKRSGYVSRDYWYLDGRCSSLRGKTAPMEAVGSIIAAGQEAKKEILVKQFFPRRKRFGWQAEPREAVAAAVCGDIDSTVLFCCLSGTFQVPASPRNCCRCAG
jgi:hypothetical protein